MRYEVRRPQVVHETIDGEVVIINLESGRYYSLRESGAAVWAGVERAADVRDIVAAVAARFEPPDGLDAEVVRLLDELESEGLVRPASVEAEPLPNANGDRRPFTPPVLEAFSDMEDLLLLDPVHDIDQQGWPHLAPET